MAEKIHKVAFSPAAREIEKVIVSLGKIRSKVTPKERKRIDLDIRELNRAKKRLKASCRKMTAVFVVS
jgi:hypothetical protein